MVSVRNLVVLLIAASSGLSAAVPEPEAHPLVTKDFSSSLAARGVISPELIARYDKLFKRDPEAFDLIVDIEARANSYALIASQLLNLVTAGISSLRDSLDAIFNQADPQATANAIYSFVFNSGITLITLSSLIAEANDLPPFVKELANLFIKSGGQTLLFNIGDFVNSLLQNIAQEQLTVELFNTLKNFKNIVAHLEGKTDGSKITFDYSKILNPLNSLIQKVSDALNKAGQ